MSFTESNAKYVILLDCNNFYVSCERLFNPCLEGKPVVVLSNNDGCVVSRSQEAKQLQVKMGVPLFQIRDLCRIHNIHVLSSNYQVYGDISRRIMRILGESSEETEIYSIDEAFLTFPISLPHNEIIEVSRDIQSKIKKWVGMPTSIGVATTKTLAKVGNAIAKKNRIGFFDITSPSTQEAVLKDFGIDEVWGIGRNLTTQLKSLGIHTAFQFREMEQIFVRKQMGVVGERMLLELRGISCLGLEEVSAKKSITCSRSFGEKLTDISDLSQALSTFVNTACTKLRNQESVAEAMCIFLEEALDPVSGIRRQCSDIVQFSIPTNDTSHMISAAKNVLKRLFKPGAIYKKCGVVLLDLMAETEVIPDFFMGVDLKRKQAMQTVDALNVKWGKNKVFYGAMGVNSKWRMRSEKRSPRYTTDWKELPIAHAGSS